MIGRSLLKDAAKVRASLECPHLRIEIWGTRVSGESDVGHLPSQRRRKKTVGVL
jgi:hypothetical protein